MSQERKHASPAHRQAAYRERREQARVLQLRERALPALPAIPTLPGHGRWNAALQHAEQLLSTVAAEMASYFDARTELWQEGDRGAAHLQRQEAVEALVEALGDLP
jgi:hypothetical protein